MTTNGNSTTQSLITPGLIRRMSVGAGIALVVITLFLISGGKGNPEWPRFWMVRPLIVVPVAGAMGGLFFHIVISILHRDGWVRVTGFLIGFLGYMIALWMGSVLGLVGTYWN